MKSAKSSIWYELKHKYEDKYYDIRINDEEIFQKILKPTFLRKHYSIKVE